MKRHINLVVLYSYCLFAACFCQISASHYQQLQQHAEVSPVQRLFEAIHKQTVSWFDIPLSQLPRIIRQSQLSQHSNQIMELLELLQAKSENVTLDSLKIFKLFQKNHPRFASTLKFILDSTQTRLGFVSQPKKIYHLSNFVKKYPKYCQRVFSQQYSLDSKGRKIGQFLRSFFQYYYLNVESQSETLSTIFFRALATRVPQLQNVDFSFCVDSEQAGDIAQALDRLDINSIFIKIPRVFDVLKHIRLKSKCQIPENSERIRKIHKRAQGIEMFRVMYEEYSEYVDIATEKYGFEKVLMVAKSIAKVLRQSEKYQKLHRETPHPLKMPGNSEQL